MLAAGLLFFARLGCPLLEPEEARYAEIAREMLAADSWATPLLHGEAYWQKPPLLYWLVMTSYSIFGIHDWAARLVPCLAAWATVIVIFWWGHRSARIGLYAAMILALSPGFVYQGRMLKMDSLLCLCVTLALATAHVALAPPPSAARQAPQRRWWLLSAVATGLALLTKGPIALVLIIGPLLVWSRLDQRCPHIRLGQWLTYAMVTGLVGAPWYCVMTWQDSSSAGDFFWLHNIQRFFAPLDHEEPAWYFIPRLLIGTLPWSLLAFALLPWMLRRSAATARHRPAALGFYAMAFMVGLSFLSLSGCKRAGYILPLLPSWSLLLATYLSQGMPERRRYGRLCAACVFLLLLIAVHHLLPDYHRRFALRGQVRRHAGDSHVPVVCYPHRRDSISYYLERDDVKVFSAADRTALLQHLKQEERTLVFVKREKHFQEFVQALPADLKFVPSAREGHNVRSGYVVRR
jgi:4-amino-4-deoxy-L-arabinose transferase-like glycosyltransferase